MDFRSIWNAASRVRRVFLVAVAVCALVEFLVVLPMLALKGIDGLALIFRLPTSCVVLLATFNSLISAEVIVELVRVAFAAGRGTASWPDRKHFTMVLLLWLLLLPAQFFFTWLIRAPALR